jgi:hypothetical protein
MSIDPNLARRVRAIFGSTAMAQRWNVAEKAMFGGLAFMLDGKMCCGILKRDLVVRVGPERWEEALALPHVRPMDFTGRAMKGFVYVAPKAVTTAKALASFIGMGVAFVRTLPSGPKKSSTRAKATRRTTRAGRKKRRASP